MPAKVSLIPFMAWRPQVWYQQLAYWHYWYTQSNICICCILINKLSKLNVPLDTV